MPLRYNLPQELTDTIIDYLIGDVYSLTSTSLVSHSWLSRSHHHLFLRRSSHTITSHAFDELYDLCSAKLSTISSGSIPEMRLLIPFDSLEFCRLMLGDQVCPADEHLINLFAGVETLELRLAEFIIVNSPTWNQRFTRFFQSVRCLRLFTASFRDAQQFCNIAFSLSELEELYLEDRGGSISKVFKDMETSSITPVLVHIPQKLRKLTLKARLCTSSPQFTSLILSLATQITEWVFLDIDRSDIPTIGQIFSSAQAKDQSWTFHLSKALDENSLMYNDASGVKDLILRHLDLRHNQNVRHINFDGEFWWYVMEPFLRRKRGGSLTSVTLPCSHYCLKDLGIPLLFKDLDAPGDTVMDVMKRVDDILQQLMVKELHFTIAVTIQGAKGGVMLSEGQRGSNKYVMYGMYEGMSGWDEVKGIHDEFVGCLPKAKKRDILRPEIIGYIWTVASNNLGYRRML